MGANGTDIGLNVETWIDEGRTILELTGDLDAHAVPALRRELLALPTGQARRVVLLLEGVPFMDKEAFGVVLVAVKRARALGGGVALVSPCERVAQMLRITGLTGVVPAFGSLEAAFAHLDAL